MLSRISFKFQMIWCCTGLLRLILCCRLMSSYSKDTIQYWNCLPTIVGIVCNIILYKMKHQKQCYCTRLWLKIIYKIEASSNFRNNSVEVTVAVCWVGAAIGLPGRAQLQLRFRLTWSLLRLVVTNVDRTSFDFRFEYFLSYLHL